VLKLLIRKFIQGVLLVLISSAVTFALLSTAGGDALSALRDNPLVSAQTIEDLRVVYGLDQPVAIRYARWLGNALTGDLGESFNFRVGVGGLVVSRLRETLLLSLAAIVLAFAGAAALCFLSVRFKWPWLEQLNEFVILITASSPRLMLALLALLAVVKLSLQTTFWLAAAALAVPALAIFLAQLNESVKATMAEDFVRLARAKGLSERAVIVRHASRAVLNPLLTLTGVTFGTFLGGSVIVETVLGRPGLGSMIVTAVRTRDIPLLMGSVLAVSIAVWAANAIAEILQMLNDKRLRAMETA
jgi:peptide/nickel transport system permease protein